MPAANVTEDYYPDYKLMVTKANYEYADLQGSCVGSPSSCNLIAVACPIGCGEAKAGVIVNMIKNPAKDKTVPFIVSFKAGTETDVITGDVFPDLAQNSITTLVAQFSENMQVSRSIKGNALDLTVTGTVTVTSAGPAPAAGASTKTFADGDIIKDYTVTMTSAGVMTITPVFKTAADWAAQIGGVHTGTALDVAWGSTATFAYVGAATYTVDFHAFGSPHLTDANFVMWTLGVEGHGLIMPGQVDYNGYLHAFEEAYQDYFIFGGDDHAVIEITVGE
jgi:hypothetical protein